MKKITVSFLIKATIGIHSLNPQIKWVCPPTLNFSIGSLAQLGNHIFLYRGSPLAAVDESTLKGIHHAETYLESEP